MAKYALGVIGAGNMAEALLKGAIAAGAVAAEKIVASDPSAQRREVMTRMGIKAVGDNLTPATCPMVLLAVKPQVLAAVLEEISPAVDRDAVVVSIAAGITTSLIDQKLRRKGRIVRVMPNTPMLVLAGASALCRGPRATDDDVARVQKLFAASGWTVVVDEAAMDAVTAVSGSGPAYFFYLIEAMIEAGIAEGLDEPTAAELAGQTCAGAAKLLRQTGRPARDLRAEVTSPGGTTQRAIETMEAAGVKQTLVKAIRAAAERSRQLGA